ncbi:MAG: tetratricopeptide repeat protein [Candidatus Lokiarchaeota archaeon]|nr:tetratricopeptide repeat protein [Candidatus Lokiarchaeota archaeon]
MNNCPFCKEPIESYWTYCRNCNKPLITNIDEELNKRSFSLYDGISYHSDDFEEEEDYYDINVIDDESIELELTQLEDQLTESEKLGKNMGNLLLRKASLFYKKREISQALKNLELAIENFLDEKNFLNVIVCHNELGLIHEETGFFDQAIYHFDRALSALEDVNDIVKKIQVLNNLGNVYYLINDLEHSYKYYQDALNLAEKENLEVDAIKTSSNLVEVLIILKDYDRVKKILKRNLEFFTQNNDVYGVIQTRIKYGKLYYYLGEDYYDQSYNSLTSVVELIDTIKNQISLITRKKLEWECFLFLGHLYSLWDNDLEAEDYFLKSLEAVRTFEVKENIKEGIVLEAIAEFYSLKGEDGKAIDYYSFSKDIYQKFGDKLKIGEMKYHVANIFQNYIQDEQKAILYYEEALEIFENLNNAKMAAEILNKLGDIYVSKQMFEQASDSFERAKEFYVEIEDEHNMNIVTEKINSLKDNDLDVYSL